MSGQEAGAVAPEGTHQNIARAASVLTALAETGARGARLTDVIAATKLSKTAVHRCLAGLAAHGLAETDGGRFFLGDRVFLWTRLAAERFELVERVVPYLKRLAEVTEDTVYFMLRRGDEAVCYGRAEGAFPIKTLTLNVGDRRPLGIGTGSLALIAYAGDAEVERIIAREAPARSAYDVSEPELRRLIARAREEGYARIDGHIMPGMSGVGVPIMGAEGAPVAALSIAAISSRLASPRREWAVGEVRAEAARLQSELALLLSRA